jgi:hypothetical protein
MPLDKPGAKPAVLIEGEGEGEGEGGREEEGEGEGDMGLGKLWWEGRHVSLCLCAQ